jgi:hypothetical protein
MGFSLVCRGWYNLFLPGQTPLEHSLEQRSPFLQRILNPISNLPLMASEGTM